MSTNHLHYDNNQNDQNNSMLDFNKIIECNPEFLKHNNKHKSIIKPIY